MKITSESESELIQKFIRGVQLRHRSPTSLITALDFTSEAKKMYSWPAKQKYIEDLFSTSHTIFYETTLVLFLSFYHRNTFSFSIPIDVIISLLEALKIKLLLLSPEIAISLCEPCHVAKVTSMTPIQKSLECSFSIIKNPIFENDDVDAFKECLQINKITNINLQNFQGNTFLMLAAKTKALNIIKHILEYYDFDDTLTNNEGDTAMIVLCENDHDYNRIIARYFQNPKAVFDKKKMAFIEDDVNAFKECLETEKITDSTAVSLMELVIEYNAKQIAAFLLQDLKINPNLLLIENQTVLWHAIASCCPEITQQLLNHPCVTGIEIDKSLLNILFILNDSYKAKQMIALFEILNASNKVTFSLDYINFDKYILVMNHPGFVKHLLNTPRFSVILLEQLPIGERSDRIKKEWLVEKHQEFKKIILMLGLIFYKNKNSPFSFIELFVELLNDLKIKLPLSSEVATSLCKDIHDSRATLICPFTLIGCHKPEVKESSEYQLWAEQLLKYV